MASGYPNSACDDAKLQRMGSDPAGLTPWHNLAIRPSNLICPAIVPASRYIHAPPPHARAGARAVAVGERAGLPRPRANARLAAHGEDPGDARPARCAPEVS